MKNKTFKKKGRHTRHKRKGIFKNKRYTKRIGGTAHELTTHYGTAYYRIINQDLDDSGKLEIINNFTKEYNIHEKDTFTPLMCASQKGYEGVVKKLFELDDPGKVNEISKISLRTALMFASENGHLEIVKLLIEKGAELNIITIVGSALSLAAKRGHLEIVKALILAGAEVEFSKKNFKEEKESYDSRMQTTLRGITFESSNIYSPLYLAAKYGHLDIVKALIEAGANVFDPKILERLKNYWRNTFKPEIKKAIKNEAETNEATKNIENLIIWSNNGEYENVENLLQRKKFIVNALANNGKNQTALMLASYTGKKEIVKLLLESGAAKNITDTDGNTALTYASKNDKTEIVELLNNDLNIKSNKIPI
jgi:ankyrin repeat protein